uniref:Uncharacterized protein n=1 Tax=Ackermannviridae sp. TaxID=2831612 RepID=A0A8S5VQ18_9CAUD|nr:MAG TPA: hypothetical protein [Ackermannviridae sp.]
MGVFQPFIASHKTILLSSKKPAQRLPCGLTLLQRLCAASVATERARACRVGVAVGVTHHAVHAVVHLQGVYLVAQLLDLVSLHQRTGLLAFGADCIRDVAGLAVHLRGQVGRRKAVLAAALRQLALDVVARLHNGRVRAGLRQRHFLAKLTNAALHLEAEIADAVAQIGQTVVQLPKVLAKQDLLLAGSGGILAKLALPVAPEAAAHEADQEQNHHPPCAVSAEAVAVTGRRAQVAQRVPIVHSIQSFRKICIYKPCRPGLYQYNTPLKFSAIAFSCSNCCWLIRPSASICSTIFCGSFPCICCLNCVNCCISAAGLLGIVLFPIACKIGFVMEFRLQCCNALFKARHIHRRRGLVRRDRVGGQCRVACTVRCLQPHQRRGLVQQQCAGIWCHSKRLCAVFAAHLRDAARL